MTLGLHDPRAEPRRTEVVLDRRGRWRARGRESAERRQPRSRTRQPGDVDGHPTIMPDVEEVEVVVAHHERSSLRVGDMFLKIDADQARTAVDGQAMAMAPI